MSSTPQEIAAVLAIVKMEWPHSQLGPGGANGAEMARDYWHSVLGAFTAAEVEGAVKEIIAAGRDHAPGPGTVLKVAAARANTVPDWDEVWREIARVRLRYSPAFPGREVPPEDAFTHPAIAAFAIPAWKELAHGPAPGTKEHGTHYAQQREAYKAIAARAQRATANAAIGAPRRGELTAASDAFAAAAAKLLKS